MKAPTTEKSDVRPRRTPLSANEQETIIRFSKGESEAVVYTYEKLWIRRLEQGLGLKPVAVNGHGGRTYELDKKLIPMPRARRKLSPEAKKRAASRLAGVRARGQGVLL